MVDAEHWFREVKAVALESIAFHVLGALVEEPSVVLELANGL